MIPYDPNSANKAPLLDEGEYSATIEEVTQKVSKSSGADMHEIVLRVDRLRVWDYITYPDAGVWKLKQIAEALGQAESFAAGTFDIEKTAGAAINVYLRVKTDPRGVKMQVGEYLKPTGKAKAAPVAAAADDDSEAVPF